MNTWAWVRVVAVGAAFVQGYVEPMSLGESEGEHLGLGIAALFLLFPVFALVVTVGMQFVNSFSDSTWRFPSWKANPFTVRQPLQFFHFAAFLFLAQGLGGAAKAITSGTRLVSAVPFILMGVGSVAGVYLCTVVYRGKMDHDA